MLFWLSKFSFGAIQKVLRRSLMVQEKEAWVDEMVLSHREEDE